MAAVLTQKMTEDHRACDHDFAEVERAVAEAAWGRAVQAFARFEAHTLAHFDGEEGLMFPAFEAETGMTSGPTVVMRMEHNQMRAVLKNMRAAIEAQDADEYEGEAETFLILIQQHNMKEESILYPMCDARLPQAAALWQQIAAKIEGASC